MFGPSISVLKDVEATLIPTGSKVTLKAGTSVQVRQALGDSYTISVNGNLVRVAGKEGDALGLAILTIPDVNDMPISVEEKIEAQLQTCFDPEISVNILELGLIYECNVLPMGKDGIHVNIVMTLTAPGCGMGPALVEEIETKLRQIKEITQVKVDLVFDPPWDRDRMSDIAKLQLGVM